MSIVVKKLRGLFTLMRGNLTAQVANPLVTPSVA
jgi:hypothetical protein